MIFQIAIPAKYLSNKIKKIIIQKPVKGAHQPLQLILIRTLEEKKKNTKKLWRKNSAGLITLAYKEIAYGCNSKNKILLLYKKKWLNKKK